MILTKTTELAIQAVAYVASVPRGTLVNPRDVAGRLGESPTYLAKVMRSMSRQGILRSQRGVSGGFQLAREPGEVSLLEIVEICQGVVPGNYCRELLATELKKTCGYHRAMKELQEAVRTVLARWTIAELLDAPDGDGLLSSDCRMTLLR